MSNFSVQTPIFFSLSYHLGYCCIWISKPFALKLSCHDVCSARSVAQCGACAGTATWSRRRGSSTSAGESLNDGNNFCLLPSLLVVSCYGGCGTRQAPRNISLKVRTALGGRSSWPSDKRTDAWLTCFTDNPRDGEALVARKNLDGHAAIAT